MAGLIIPVGRHHRLCRPQLHFHHQDASGRRAAQEGSEPG